MNFKRLPGARLAAAAAIALLLFSACDSPLEIETPRNRFVDEVSVLPGEDIGTPVSVDVPVDTSGGRWIPAHFSAALVLDASGSIPSAMNSSIRQGGIAFLDSMDGVQDEALVVYFSSTATVVQPLTTDIPALRRAVDSLPRSGSTAVWDGMHLAMNTIGPGARHERKAIIVVTESDDNSSVIATPTRLLTYAEAQGIMVFTITLHLTSRELVLRNLAERTGGRHYSLPSLNRLPGIFREIAGLLRRP